MVVDGVAQGDELRARSCDCVVDALLQLVDRLHHTRLDMYCPTIQEVPRR
jgi:hypothetical protein